jgi:hypothetical protein
MEQAELVAAVRVILDKTEGFCDEGPEGEGWRSNELSCAICTLREWADAIDPPPPPPPLTPLEQRIRDEVTREVIEAMTMHLKAQALAD